MLNELIINKPEDHFKFMIEFLNKKKNQEKET